MSQVADILKPIGSAVGAIGGVVGGALGIAGATQKAPRAPGITGGPVEIEEAKEEEKRKRRLQLASSFGQRSTILVNPLGRSGPLGGQTTLPTLTGR